MNLEQIISILLFAVLLANNKRLTKGHNIVLAILVIGLAALVNYYLRRDFNFFIISLGFLVLLYFCNKITNHYYKRNLIFCVRGIYLSLGEKKKIRGLDYLFSFLLVVIPLFLIIIS